MGITLPTEYLMKPHPSVSRAISSKPDSYVYLAGSMQPWPDQQALATEIGRSGWRSVE
jgi:demethylmenaquinone methyltransferase/2-methoxy-6-polyprenyl-1,4-benzoquinol methylase